MCGYLKIHGLTEVRSSLASGKSTIFMSMKEYPTLTTFFEGEIISERYPFLTRKWDASEEVDKKHWSKFPSFSKFAKNFNSDSFSYADVKDSDSVFMRWKVWFDVQL